MNDHRRLVRRVGIDAVVGIIGLTMLLWALERTSLVGFAEGAGANPPFRVFLTMFVGLAAVNLCTFDALKRWSQYLRDHPETRQVPVWFLLVLLLSAGGSLIFAMATHAGYLRGLDTVSTTPSMGYVGFQVVMAMFVIISLVLLASRWAPGYKRPAGAPIADA